MMVYKVFCKNYRLKKGELMGALVERRTDLRGVKQFESGLRWAKLTFGDMVQDKKSIFVIPNELKLNDDVRYMEKWKRSKEDFLEMLRMVDCEMKKRRRLSE